MRVNKYVAQATGLSRRAADRAIEAGRVRINQKQAVPGDKAGPEDSVYLDNGRLVLNPVPTTIILNKPAGYVCSRSGQGSKTVYDLLPREYRRLKTVGRLDKDTSGLLLLSDNGELANTLTHPSYGKNKVYQAGLNKKLALKDKKKLLTGVRLADGPSKFINIADCSDKVYEITLQEGRNRQIRRTFQALDYKIVKLRRIKFGDYSLPAQLGEGEWELIET
ncbi:MAG TPA: pseudouridine synthase [Candidatus Saccharimonadales bacterium]|nr:pseudouridine synthase [Candidatus Saccharimonadales bacterium]